MSDAEPTPGPHAHKTLKPQANEPSASVDTQTDDKPLIWERRWFQITLGALLICVTLGVVLPPIASVIYKVRGILVPVLIALGLAYVFDPLVTHLEKKRNISRGTSSGAIIAFFAIGLLTLVLLVVPPVVVQGSALVNSLSTKLPQILYDEADRQAGAADNQQDAANSNNPPNADAPQPNQTPTETKDNASTNGTSNDTQTAMQAVVDAIETQANQAEGTANQQADQSQTPAVQSQAAPSDANGQVKNKATQLDNPGWFQLGKNVLSQAMSESPKDREQMFRAMADAVQTIDLSTLARAVMNSLDVGTNLVGSVFGIGSYLLLSTLVVAFSFYFFSWKFHGVLAWCVPFIPIAHRHRTLDILGKMNTCTTAFIRGRLIQSLVMGLILSIGWLIADVPYWLLLGIAGGLLNLIPFAGFFVWPVAIALTWLDRVAGNTGFSMWAVFLWPSLVYGLAQTLDGWVVEPLVQGKATNLNPLAVFLAVMVGGSLAGLLGMLLAIPAAACIKILLDEVILPELRRFAADRDALT